VPVEAVIFDWGGTLTPWRTIDADDEWRSLARVAAPEAVDETTRALVQAATQVWARSRDEHLSATIEEICLLAGLPYDLAHWEGYREFWEHATFIDPDAPPVFEALREQGIKVGVLSNTVWPAAWHDEIFLRDGVFELIDGAVYTSSIDWTKPAPQAFRAAMSAVGATDVDRCVFVGDRLFDDIHGAHAVGMRTIYLPHSDIPAEQVGHTVGEPDATIESLSEIPKVIEGWN
jgi:putative hydrolase of the HAD superfamily